MQTYWPLRHVKNWRYSMKKVYIVYSYFTNKMNGRGYSSAILELENPILSEEDIDAIEQTILNANEDYLQVLILNWKELSV